MLTMVKSLVLFVMLHTGASKKETGKTRWEKNIIRRGLYPAIIAHSQCYYGFFSFWHKKLQYMETHIEY